MTTTIHLQIRATPKARPAELKRKPDGTLLARVPAPASDGLANKSLIRLLARTLGLRQSELVIQRGTRSRNKQIAVEAPDPSSVYAAIAELELES